MPETRVWTFFYGSYINLNVLQEVNYSRKSGKSPAWLGSTSLFGRARISCGRSSTQSTEL